MKKIDEMALNTLTQLARETAYYNGVAIVKSPQDLEILKSFAKEIVEEIVKELDISSVYKVGIINQCKEMGIL